MREMMTKSVIEFRDEVKGGIFPSLNHSYD